MNVIVRLTGFAAAAAIVFAAGWGIGAAVADDDPVPQRPGATTTSSTPAMDMAGHDGGGS